MIDSLKKLNLKIIEFWCIDRLSLVWAKRLGRHRRCTRSSDDQSNIVKSLSNTAPLI